MNFNLFLGDKVFPFEESFYTLCYDYKSNQVMNLSNI